MTGRICMLESESILMAMREAPSNSKNYCKSCLPDLAIALPGSGLMLTNFDGGWLVRLVLILDSMIPSNASNT